MSDRSSNDIPRLVQRNGVYNVVWTTPVVKDPVSKRVLQPARTKRFGLRTRDPDEATAAYAAFLTQGKTLVRGAGAAGLSVRDALDHYYVEHVLGETADPVRQENAIRHLVEFFGDLPLSEVDIPKCRGYADARRSGLVGGGARKQGDLRKGSDSTIRRELVVLSAAANHAARWKRIGPSAAPATPMPTFEMPSGRRDAEETPWIDKQGVMTLLLASSGPLHHFVKLAYVWAARRGWVERLHVSQIDLTTGRVNPYRPGEQVTKKRRSVMPVFPQIRGNLEQLVREARNGYIFGSPEVDFYRPFRKLCDLTGYEDRGHPHVLRHSRATHLLMDGQSIYRVARLLGDSVQTVERVYGHWSVEFLTEGKQR